MDAAARKASRKLVRDFGEIEELQVSRKGTARFVNAANQRTEGILLEELSRARPSFGFLTEESGGGEGQNSNERWIIDPINGTLNFLHGIPNFAISIGVERDGELIAGVIYEPIRDELFWAEKNEGAFVNRRRIRVSGRKTLADAILTTETSIRDSFARKTLIAMINAALEKNIGRPMVGIFGAKSRICSCRPV